MSSFHNALVLIHVDHRPSPFSPGFYLDCPMGRHINGPQRGKRGKLEWFTGSSLPAHCLHPLKSWDCGHVTFSVSCSCCSYPVPIRSRMVRVLQGCQSWGSLLGLYPLSSLLQINGPLPNSVTYTECAQFISVWTLVEIGLLSSDVLHWMWPYLTLYKKAKAACLWNVTWEDMRSSLSPKITSSVLSFYVKLTRLKSQLKK